MAALVTTAQAHAHLRLPFVLNASPADPRQADLELKVNQAEVTILDYCNSTAYWRAITPTWLLTASPVGSPPAFVTAAVLLLLGHLWDHRGDDMVPDDKVWEAIGRLLARSRDPVVS
jgi:hypothetical protein